MVSGQNLECREGKKHLGRDRDMSHQRWFHFQKKNTRCLKNLTWWVAYIIKRVFLYLVGKRTWYALIFFCWLCPLSPIDTTLMESFLPLLFSLSFSPPGLTQKSLLWLSIADVLIMFGNAENTGYFLQEN